MRKTMKRKRRSCPMCKPNKTGGAPRWNVKELQSLRIAEREIREGIRDDS